MSNPEDEYFARLEKEKRDKLREELETTASQQSREQLKQLHWHRCGKCGTEMKTHPFRGVDIEVCPQCGATLLDKGELEHLAGKDQSGIFQGIVDLFHGSRSE